MRHIAPLLSGLVLACAASCHAGTVDLSQAVVVIRPGKLANAEKAAATVLIDEMEKRSGIRLSESTTWPEARSMARRIPV